jgi:hypothetical protein
VTFLFTDIEGSTSRWESDSESMRSALAAHDQVLRSAVEGHGGWLFKHTGDGVCAAFGSARAAIDAAVAAQRELGLPVRMGVVTGEVQERGGDYFGPTLNRAARVMEVGYGGQILVASSTAGLLDGVDLTDLGEHRLRDLSGAHRLFQVRADGLGEVFPALRTLDGVPVPHKTPAMDQLRLPTDGLVATQRDRRSARDPAPSARAGPRHADQHLPDRRGEKPSSISTANVAAVVNPCSLRPAARV